MVVNCGGLNSGHYNYYWPTFRLCVEVKPILYKRWFSISWSCLLSIIQDRDGQLGDLMGTVWSDHPEHGQFFLSSSPSGLASPWSTFPRVETPKGGIEKFGLRPQLEPQLEPQLCHGLDPMTWGSSLSEYPVPALLREVPVKSSSQRVNSLLWGHAENV